MGCNSSDLYGRKWCELLSKNISKQLLTEKLPFTIVCEESKSTIITVVIKKGHDEIQSQKSFNLKLLIK